MSGRRKRVATKRTATNYGVDLDRTFENLLFSVLMGSPPRRRARRAATRAPRKRSTAPATVTSSVATPNPDTIEIEDSPVNSEMKTSVESRLQDFMTSGGFISDDSDDDVGTPSKSTDGSEPSTSTANNVTGHNNSSISKIENDVIEFVDTVLDKQENKKDDTEIKDLKSLEDYRKETEEMLKNATALLDQFKEGRKPQQVEEKKPKSPEKEGKSCPICLDNITTAATTMCGHVFCKNCIEKVAVTTKKCPTCRKGITQKKIIPIFL